MLIPDCEICGAKRKGKHVYFSFNDSVRYVYRDIACRWDICDNCAEHHPDKQYIEMNKNLDRIGMELEFVDD